MPGTALTADALYRHCRLDDLEFRTTDDLQDLPAIGGHARAREAIELAVSVRRQGYNLFVLGPPGLGKLTLVRQMLAEEAARQPAPDDWCYVHSFRHPQHPNALRLPSGMGNRLRQEARHFVDELRAAIPAIFENDEYRRRVEQIDAELSDREGQMFEAINKEAMKDNIALVHTPTGFSFAPTRNGEVLTAEEYDKLSDAEREVLEGKLGQLQGRLQDAIRLGHKLHVEKRERIKQLNREMTMVAVGALADDLKAHFAGQAEVLAWLDEMQADVLENIDDFRRTPEQSTNLLGMPVSDPDSFRRYTVNVLVGNDQPASGAPVVIADHPTHNNLLGRIEHVARLGTLATDFTLIRPGALHRANGGYLLIDAYKLLSEPFAWTGLKRALSSGEVRVESLGESYSLISTVGLEPEPIPIDLKVVIFGDRLLYYLLLAYDTEFAELFKVAADFDDDLERSAGHEALYARLIATIVHRDQLLAFERAAVARTIEQCSRWAEDRERLSAQVEQLGNLLREADHHARRAAATVVTVADVETAIDAGLRRAARVQERLQDAILRQELLISTDGEKVAQVNGLSVMMLGEHSFAHPTRITATTRLGDGEFVDIQREVDLGGPIHSKGVLTLTAFLAARYAAEQPLSLAATLAFEQTYGEVEGDSASIAEIAALLSSLAGVPIRQWLAVTGSINQLGDVQAIGGVNEKIEGFFDICRRRGLTGQQGVIIPAANVQHLMLRADVVQAVRDGRFHVHAVSRVDEAISLLTGQASGERDESGRFPPDSLNGRIATRLTELSMIRQAYANMEVRMKRVKSRKAGKPRPESQDPPQRR